MITPSTLGTPTAGETFSLDCSVNGTTNPATYQWFEGSAGSGIQISNVSQLQFFPSRVSHAGLYTCQATVRSVGVVVEGSAAVTVNCKCFY